MLKVGHVIDIYDDADGKHLRDGALLKKYASLEVDPPEKLASLMDKDFALVIFTKTGEKHRKFAVHTPDALAISHHYFSKVADDLSPEARTIAATNLAKAHLRHGATEIPEDLEKAASKAVVGPYFNEAVERPLITAPAPAAEPKYATKYALERKLSDDRRVQIFPMDTLEEVQASVETLKKVAFDLSGRDRCKAAMKLQEALQGFQQPQDEVLAKLAAFDPNPAFLTHMEARRAALTDDQDIATLDSLIKVAGSLSGPTLAAAVETFDRKTGISRHWDRAIRNPWDSCLTVKEAGVKAGSKTITKEALVQALDAGKLDGLFKKSTIADFKKAPLEVFKSLPDPTKETIANLLG